MTVHVSPGSAETVVTRSGITNRYLIAYCLSNVSAQNYQNRLMCVKVIVCRFFGFWFCLKVYIKTDRVLWSVNRRAPRWLACRHQYRCHIDDRSRDFDRHTVRSIVHSLRALSPTGCTRKLNTSNSNSSTVITLTDGIVCTNLTLSTPAVPNRCCS